MKFLIKLVLLIFIIGLILSVVAFFGGVNLENIGTYFVDDEAYGDPIEYVSTTEIDSLDVQLDTRNIVISIAIGDEIIVTYHAHEKDTWSVNEVNGTLNIVQTTKPTFFSWFNFKIASEEVLTVYIEIPADLFLDYSLDSDVGNISYIDGPQNIDDLSIDTDTGKVEIENATMNSLTVQMSTGSIILSNLTILGDLDANTSTGNVVLDTIVANQMTLNTKTGKIIADDIIANELITETSTGRIEIRSAVISGIVELTTSTGSITVTNSNATSFDLASSTGNISFSSTTSMDLRYDLDTTVGNITVNGDDQGSKHSTSTGAILLKARVSTGNITINVQD